MTQPDLTCIILAAGDGQRIGSQQPKVLHQVAGRSLLEHVVAAASNFKPDHLLVVTSPQLASATEVLVHPYTCCIQPAALGTADAVATALVYLQHRQQLSGDVIVLCGDTPLITQKTLKQALALRRQALYPGIVVVGMRPEHPAHYGRLLCDANGYLERIIEYAEASPEQQAITLCNSGIIILSAQHALGWLKQINNQNSKGEYYLTDIIPYARADGAICQVWEAPASEMLGVNTRSELARAEHAMQQILRQQALDNGVTLIDPGSVFLTWDTQLGRDVVIYPYVVLGNRVEISDRVVIHSFCQLSEVYISSDSVIGPFAHLRGDSYIGEGGSIGNFVELKHSHLAAGVKIRHLSYIGDAQIGQQTNIGAGTITCNYDGQTKHTTTIGSRTFIGTHSALVAPVNIGDGALVAAGSVITQNVEPAALAIARSRQRNLPGVGQRLLERDPSSTCCDRQPELDDDYTI